MNEHEYKKGRYYNEYYADSLHLITTDKIPVNESEAESYDDFGPQEKNIVGSLKNVLTFARIFNDCKSWWNKNKL